MKSRKELMFIIRGLRVDILRVHQCAYALQLALLSGEVVPEQFDSLLDQNTIALSNISTELDTLCNEFDKDEEKEKTASENASC